MGAQLLSGRVFDSRPRCSRFEPHRCHCVVSLSKTHLSLLSTGSTLEGPSRHNLKIVDWDVKNQIKQNNKVGIIEIHCTYLGVSGYNFEKILYSFV